MKTLIFKDFVAFKEMQGKELPTTNWIAITQEMITDFANATFDKQWIHVDEKRAEKESPFKSTVAHGFMSVAMISKLLEEVFSIESIKMGLNYGLNKVRFPNPVPVNSELRMLSTVKSIEALGNNGIKVTFNCIIEIKNQEKPACVAEFIAALFE
jgi:acyl dehydratase